MPANRTITGTDIASAGAHAPAGHVDWTIVAALLAAVLFLLAAVLPAPMVLLGLSVLFVTVGFGIAATLYLAGYRLKRNGHRAWEVAALLVFFGFAAAMLSDTREVLAALDLAQSLAAVSK